MKTYAIPLLLYSCLCTLAAADVPTFVERDAKEYFGDGNDRELGPNEIHVEDTGDLHIILGSELSARVMKIANEDCKDPGSGGCKDKMRDALGVGPTANGLQKRVIVHGVVAAFAYLLSEIMTYKGTIWNNPNPVDRVHAKFPKAQKEEVQDWNLSENKFNYKPQDGDAVEVVMDNNQPEPEKPVTFSKDDNGDVTITLPGLAEPIKEAWGIAGCGSTGMRRSLEKRVTPRDIDICAQAILRIAAVGGAAVAIAFINPFDFYKQPDTELYVESRKNSREYMNKIIYPPSVDSAQKDNMADFVTHMAMTPEAGITFDGDKMFWRASFIQYPEKTLEETCDPDKDPNVNSPLCDDDGCAGEDSRCTQGKNQGCRCTEEAEAVIDYQFDKEFADEQHKVLQEALSGSTEIEPKKTCYKEDAERMSNKENWKFVQQETLAKAIETFCSEFTTTTGNEKVVTSRTFNDGSNEDWNTVTLHAQEPKGGLLDPKRCTTLFSHVSTGCDGDPVLNEFDFKWGGEYQDTDGVWVWFEPHWSRVWRGDEPKLFHGNLECRSKKEFKQTNDDKGNNNTPLDDSAKMTLQMCIHQMRHSDKDLDVACGGLLFIRTQRKSYDSKWDCANNTWKCLSYWVDNGKTVDAFHVTGSAACSSRIGYEKLT